MVINGISPENMIAIYWRKTLFFNSTHSVASPWKNYRKLQQGIEMSKRWCEKCRFSPWAERGGRGATSSPGQWWMAAHQPRARLHLSMPIPNTTSENGRPSVASIQTFDGGREKIKQQFHECLSTSSGLLELRYAFLPSSIIILIRNVSYN